MDKSIYSMFEKEISEYDALVADYKCLVADRYNPNDFKEYNEILFSCHSCGIEGNSFTIDETQTLKEKGLGMIPAGKSLLETFEMLDHFKAYEFLFSHLDKPLSESLLKETHQILMNHTLEFRTRLDDTPSKPGEYTTQDMTAGGVLFGDHKKAIARIPDLLDSTQKALDENKIHPMIISARFHGIFENLHPFRDGNGRIGRLFSNFILLKRGLPLLIIENENREEYLSSLALIRRERTDEFLISFFFQTAISRMKKEINEKRDMTDSYLRGFFF